MAARCPGATLAGPAELPGYRLAFDLFSERWGGYVADIVPDPGSRAYGLLWRVTGDHMAALDRFEGVASGRYRRVTVSVRSAAGEQAAIAYAAAAPGPEGPPTGAYWAIIASAAREYGFPVPDRPPHPPVTATVLQVNVSSGGVPKLPVLSAFVTALGLEGDAQRDTKHHGGPERAVCLFSADRIAALQAEGHPITPGATGENLTIAGLDWALVRPGSRLRIGAEVELEVTRYTTPCANIRDAFAGGDISRILQDRHPGDSRVYARVLREGTVAPGDVVEPL